MAHDARDDGTTDMTADNMAPADEPTRDPANTELPAHGDQVHGDQNEENEK